MGVKSLEKSVEDEFVSDDNICGKFCFIVRCF